MRVLFLRLLLGALLPCALRAQDLPTFTDTPAQVEIDAIAVDATGNTYLTGIAQGAITTTPGAFQSQDNASGTCLIVPMVGIGIACQGSLVEKLDPTGAVVFATYLSGSAGTSANGIAVDQEGNAYIAGTITTLPGATSTFPTTPGAAFSSGTGFVVKLNPSGTGLVYSTLIPGASFTAIAIDQDGNAYVTGNGNGSSTGFPVTPGAFQSAPKSNNNVYPGLVAKLNASGSALVYATYLAGSGAAGGNYDYPGSIAVDAAGDAFIAGGTNSTDFPVTAGALETTSPNAGNNRVDFLTKLNPQGTGLVFSTFINEGTGSVELGLDAQGTAYLAGATNPRIAMFPTTPGELAIGSGLNSGFLARFSADGSKLLYSTYLPTGFFGGGSPLTVDSFGNAAVVLGTGPDGGSPGQLFSDSPMPAGVGAFQPQYASGIAGSDANIYIERFSPAGQFAGGTYLGGSKSDTASLIALAPNGSMVVAGSTTSPDFPGIAQPVPTNGKTTFVTNFFPSLIAQNAASFASGAIAPGEIVSLRGYGIGPAAGVVSGGAVLPDQLAGVSVTFNGIAAPLLYVQAGQINAQVPWELAGQASASVVVSYPGVSSNSTPMVVAPAMPGIFGVVNPDGSVNSASNLAHSGDIVALFGTGAGGMNLPGSDGANWPLAPLSSITQAVSVMAGAEATGVLYSGSAPGLESGLFQINVQLPVDLKTGAQRLTVSIAGVESAAVELWVQ